MPLPSPVTVTSLTFFGRLTHQALDEQLRGVAFVAGDRVGLIIDVRSMSDYDREARERFVAWNRERKQAIIGVAIVTDKKLWRMVVSAMGIAAGQRIAPFDNADAARAWLDTIVAD